MLSIMSSSLQTSRIRDLAAFAGTKTSQPHSQTSECGSGSGSQDSAPSQLLAEILYTRLVVSGRRGRGEGREGVDAGLQQISQKNFKTFQKVHYIIYATTFVHDTPAEMGTHFAVHMSPHPLKP